METNTTGASSDSSTQASVQDQNIQQQQTAAPPELKPSIPEKYELKLGDNSQIDNGYLESFQAYAKEQKMTQEQAQQLLDREQFAVSEYSKKQVAEFEATQKQWIDSVKNDPEIGGDNFQANVELAHRALKKYGTPQFMQELESTGYGNHPELVRLFTRIGKAMADDKMISANTMTSGKKSFEEVFYGSQNQ